MNVNFTLQCDTCGDKTNLRFGFSNRYEQPVGFACQTCESPIDIVIRGTGADYIAENMKINITGATDIGIQLPFDAKTNFVDAHIDFPASFEPYVMGLTPFMRAAGRIGQKEMGLHQFRLNYLNQEVKNARDFQNILKLYANQKYKPFKLNIKRIFGISVDSDKPQDINAALYTLIAKMMFPYEYPRQSLEAVYNFTNITTDIANSHKANLDVFVRNLINSNFLKNLQHDVLKIYPQMLGAELIMRPALFLDFDEEYAKNPIAMRVSTEDFESYKDLYKDILEIISRQIILVAGFNNLLKRGNADNFAPKKTKRGDNIAPETLDAFAGVSLGVKKDFIDDCWHDFLEGSINNQLRNAIAHNNTEYNEVTQLLLYYPNNNGMARNKSKQIHFLEFVRCLLIAYREMHRLHHLIKSLFYYYYLIMEQDQLNTDDTIKN